MSRGVNKVTLVGNLGNDPETKYTQGGQAITKVSLATTTAWRDKDGNQQERTEWHRVVFFGKLGEIADEYLHKGSQIYVEGSIRYGKYTDNDGVERYTTDIIGNEMQMLGERGGGQGSSQSSAPQRQQSSRSQQSSRPARQPERQARQPAQQEKVKGGDFADDFADDDIPF